MQLGGMAMGEDHPDLVSMQKGWRCHVSPWKGIPQHPMETQHSSCALLFYKVFFNNDSSLCSSGDTGKHIKYIFHLCSTSFSSSLTVQYLIITCYWSCFAFVFFALWNSLTLCMIYILIAPWIKQNAANSILWDYYELIWINDAYKYSSIEIPDTAY